MNADTDYLEQVIRDPRERLNLEVKSWLDLTTKRDQGKLAKACLALRNHDGGYLVIGFDDKSAAPQARGRPSDLRRSYHIDVVQGIVTRFASQSFEVRVEFPLRGGVEYPIVIVPSGVRTPVAARSDLLDDNGSKLVKANTVYVRSLSASNVPGTSEAHYSDWTRLVDTCMDNREADTARFIRRHLGAIDAEKIEEIARAFAGIAEKEREAKAGAITIMEESEKRFEKLTEERGLKLPEEGFWHLGAAVEPAISGLEGDWEFLNLISATNPKYTGWPPWLDSRGFRQLDHHPFVAGGYWEAFIGPEAIGSDREITYWRLSPRGVFFQKQTLDDDARRHGRSPEPLKFLDPVLVIWRIAEAVAVVAAFARAMGAERETASVEFACRWTRVSRRTLACWSDPGRVLSPRTSHQDQVDSRVVMPLDAPGSSIYQYVEALVRPLLAVFEGFVLDSTIYEEITRSVLKSRVN